jgi:ferric-dicitrate binding protein FerR (iron transport regulator)
MTVTRQIISDLWPLYESGEASPDTRALVESFLASDPAFARTLRDSADVTLKAAATPPLPADHEVVALDRTRRRLWGLGWRLRLAMLFSGLALGRIVSDTTFDVSPRAFLILTAIASVFWIAFIVDLLRRRASILIVARKPPSAPAAG